MGRNKLAAVVIGFIFFSMAFSQTAAADDEEEPVELEEGHVNRIAVLNTDFGTIRFELYEDWTPITAQNFIDLAEAGHYTNVLFHRIVDDFVIQTGDGGGSATIPLEVHPNATHVDGAVGMARSEDPDSASDQFYICDGAQHGLDDQSINPDEDDAGYAVFGVVIEGMDVVRTIASTPVYGENNPRPGGMIPLIWYNVGEPKEDVYLKNVSIEEPEVNETGPAVYPEVEETNIPGWALGFILLPMVAVAAWQMFFRKRKPVAIAAAPREVEPLEETKEVKAQPEEPG